MSQTLFHMIVGPVFPEAINEDMPAPYRRTITPPTPSVSGPVLGGPGEADPLIPNTPTTNPLPHP